jgi:ABC-type multidrug transport system ATPase subunit
VFKGFDIEVTHGQITCLLGHNGAGKTTLLKLIYGLLVPQSGHIEIDRRFVAKYDDVYLVAEKFGINQELSLRQNLVFRSLLLNEDQTIALNNPVIGLLKMTSYLDVPTNKLSAGNFVRANLINGLVFSPSLLLLDEPTNSIDPASRELIAQELQKQRDNGVTTILVTHDLDLAYSISDRIVVIEEGEIVLDDTGFRSYPKDVILQKYLKHTEHGE